MPPASPSPKTSPLHPEDVSWGTRAHTAAAVQWHRQGWLLSPLLCLYEPREPAQRAKPKSISKIWAHDCLRRAGKQHFKAEPAA